MRATKSPSVPALVRGPAILERIAKSRRGLTFAQLTRQLDFPKSSVDTLLLTFERQGYLKRDGDTGRYMTGIKLLNIASMTIDGVVLREKAAPFLHALADTTAMTADLAVLDGTKWRSWRRSIAVDASTSPLELASGSTSTAESRQVLDRLPAEVDRLIGDRSLRVTTRTRSSRPRSSRRSSAGRAPVATPSTHKEVAL